MSSGLIRSSSSKHWLACALTTLCVGAAACNSDGSHDVAADGGGSAGTGKTAGDGGTAQDVDAGTGPSHDKPLVKGKVVALSLNSDDTKLEAELKEQLEAVESLDAAGMLAKHEVEYVPTLGYDPSKAVGLSTIQGSTLALDADEQALLAKNGFVVSKKQKFPTMLYGYASLYVQDLPLYVSADSILDAMHISYDRMLEDVEEQVLISELGALLDRMRERLPMQPKSASVTDADFFLAVTKGLLDGKPASPVVDAKSSEITQFVSDASTAEGTGERDLFGFSRLIDFSQFKPRGHYTDSEQLSQYFRAMMWLGRIDLRMIETLGDGSRVFHRRQLETALLLRDLAGDDGMQRWQRIDTTLEAFVGKSDYMRLPELASLLKDLGVQGSAALAPVSDEKIAQAVIDGGYGAQQIASQLIVNGTDHTLPLDRSFALFGQRYVVDSHVFSNVVYDRVAGRLMPNPLDVAFAALGNDQAAALLKPELDKYAYAPALEKMRLLVDAHGKDYWNQNLYAAWLGSLRTLSPTPTPVTSAEMPSVMGTETWGRRLLNTQLASWSELRHDTILYAKQSYSSGLGCSYPDAYVDPYPELYAALGRYAELGNKLADSLAGGAGNLQVDALHAYFTSFSGSMKKLAEMASLELEGKPFTTEQMAFINDAVRNNGVRGCAGPAFFDGWYAKLIYGSEPNGDISSESDPIVADVHTQPTDEAGNDVGRILHVGTSLPRLMVVTTDSCDGPRAFAGLAFGYHEVVTEHWKRMDDPEWAESLQSTMPPAEVPWTSSFVSTK